MSSSGEELRSRGEQSKKPTTRKEGSRPKASEVHQGEQQETTISQAPISSEKVSIRYSPTFLQVLSSIQQVACVGVAIWDYIHTRDLTRFIFLILAGQIDLSRERLGYKSHHGFSSKVHRKR